MQALICEKCKWNMTEKENFAIKRECPQCKNKYLIILNGTEDEVINRTKKIIGGIMKRKWEVKEAQGNLNYEACLIFEGEEQIATFYGKGAKENAKECVENFNKKHSKQK